LDQWLGVGLGFKLALGSMLSFYFAEVLLYSRYFTHSASIFRIPQFPHFTRSQIRHPFVKDHIGFVKFAIRIGLSYRICKHPHFTRSASASAHLHFTRAGVVVLHSQRGSWEGTFYARLIYTTHNYWINCVTAREAIRLML